MSNYNAESARQVKKFRNSPLSFRARLEQLENRTLLSTTCQGSNDLIGAPQPPEDLNTNHAAIADYWSSWHDASDFVNRDDSLAKNVLGTNWFDSGDDSGYLEYNRQFSDSEPNGGRNGSSSNNSPDTSPDASNDGDPHAGSGFDGNSEPRNGGFGDRNEFDGRGNANWRDGDPFADKPHEADFGDDPLRSDEAFENWIEPIELPGGIYRPPPQRPPRGVANPLSAIIAPLSQRSQPTASSPLSYWWQSATSAKKPIATEPPKSQSACVQATASVARNDESAANESEFGALTASELAASPESCGDPGPRQPIRRPGSRPTLRRRFWP